MDKKGEMNVATFLLLFISVIVGIVLLIASAQNVGKTRDSATYDTGAGSATVVAPADGVTIDLLGQELLSTPVVVNQTTGNTVVAASNYTIDEGVSATTGLKSIQYTAIGSTFDGDDLNLSYTLGGDGYIDNSGARSVAGLIIIFAALAVGVITLVPSMREGVMNKIGI